MNFLRKTTEYSNEVEIWVYSNKIFKMNNLRWHHTTEEVKYYKNFLYKLNKGKKNIIIHYLLIIHLNSIMTKYYLLIIFLSLIQI